eukprot:scaffold23627_cov18-Prasinocladus_malaysianus.AAC.1
MLNASTFLAASTDNLNFRFKYAYKLGEAGCQRALAVMTTQCNQVCQKLFHSADKQETVAMGHSEDLETSFGWVEEKPKFMHQFRFLQDGRPGNGLEQFHMADHTEAATLFDTCTLTCLLSITLSNQYEIFEDLQNLKGQTLTGMLRAAMPHRPGLMKRHNTYPVMIAECNSANLGEVSDYLVDLRLKMKIGEDGGPPQLVLAGDQQTYALMVDAKRGSPDKFRWLIPYIGDWHLAFNASQTIAEMIWEGGMQDVAVACDLTGLKPGGPWRDLHLAHPEYKAKNVKQIKPALDAWRCQLYAETSKNQTVAFWAKFLESLDAYIALYIAIRTGNWALRCWALRKLAVVFVAMGKPNYTKLVAQSIADFKLLPNWVLKAFEEGHFTVSQKGSPGCNMALDEAHEAIINRMSKRYVGRASEHRLQDMAGFLHHLGEAINTAEEWFMRFTRKRSERNSYFSYTSRASEAQRVMKVYNDLMRPMRESWAAEQLLQSHLGLESGDVLTGPQRDQLLGFSAIGEQRLLAYVRQELFTPPLELRQKKRKAKILTFASTAKKAPRQERRVERSLTAVIEAQATRIRELVGYFSVSPLPAAISKANGDMRSDNLDAEMRKGQKSSMLSTILQKVCRGEDGKIDMTLCCSTTCPWMLDVACLDNDVDFDALPDSIVKHGTDHAVLIDALRKIHVGATAGHETYRSWARYIRQILSDSDLTMYGLALMGTQLMAAGKYVMIERREDADYLSLNKMLELTNKVHQAPAVLLLLYLITGSDYVSSFYMIGPARWLTILLENYDFITSPSDVPGIQQSTSHICNVRRILKASSRSQPTPMLS